MKLITTIFFQLIVLFALAQNIVVPYELKGKWFCFSEKYNPDKKDPGRYDKIEYIEDGVYQVWSKRKAGLVDKFGKILLPTEYLPVPAIVKFSNGMYPLQKDGKILFFTNKGELAFEWKFEKPPYSHVYYKNGLLDTEFGFVDKNGKVAIMIPEMHNSLNGLNENGLIQASIKKTGNGRTPGDSILFGVIDATGKKIVDFKYASLKIDDHNEIIIASNPADFGQHDFVCYDLKGKKIFRGRYYSLDMYCKGALYIANQNYDDNEPLRLTRNKKLIDTNYLTISNFPGNRIIGYKHSETNIINHQGKKVMKFPGWADIKPNDYGRYRITTGNTVCMYDSNDKKLFCLTGYSIPYILKDYKDGYIIFDLTTEKRGFVNLKGEILVQAVYDRIIYKEDLGIWLVEINKQQFYLDDKGNKYYDSN